MEAYTARSDVCSQKLRDWRRKGSEVSELDLRKAYLQVHVQRSLWPFQTVMVKGQRYCLTRMGFGLNVAPSIMLAIVETVLFNKCKCSIGDVGIYRRYIHQQQRGRASEAAFSSVWAREQRSGTA